MIHVIYDQLNGMSLPDSRVIEWATDCVEKHAMSADKVTITVGNYIMVRALTYAMKLGNIPHTTLSIEYSHTDKQIWVDEDYQFDGYYDFCDDFEIILMELL